MIGLKLKLSPQDFAAAARRRRLLTIPAGDNVVRLRAAADRQRRGVRRRRAAARRSLRRPRSLAGGRQERRLRMIPTAALGARRRHFLDLLDFRATNCARSSTRPSDEGGSAIKGETPSTRPLAGKTLAMIFDRPSTRTRVSFDVGDAPARRRDDHAHRRRDAARPRRDDRRHRARAVALRRRDHDPHPRPSRPRRARALRHACR